MRNAGMMMMSFLASVAAGCASQPTAPGACGVTVLEDGTRMIQCSDGTQATIQDGANGVNGSTMLVRVDAEPAGANCASGGEAVRVGVDQDGDRELSDDEITGTGYVCSAPSADPPFGATLAGSFAVYNEADLARLSSVTHITGDLDFYVEGVREIVLPNLAKVDGYLGIWGNSWDNATSTIETIRFPKLAQVGNQLYISGTALRDLSGLSALSGPLYGLTLMKNFALTSLDGLGSVTSIDYISAWSNDALASVALPAVTTVKMFSVSEHPALTTITLPALTQVDSISIYDNPALPQCAVDELIAQVTGPPPAQYTAGNDDHGACEH